MQFNLIIIILLIIILIVLLLFFFQFKNNSIVKTNFEIKQINDNLNNLINKTIEQQSTVNLKINEIGDLTKKITNAMTANISDMGSMGEAILENILQDCGMTKGRDYEVQLTGKDENGNILRPDIVIFLPENRNIIIDSKMPMKDWYEYQNSEDEVYQKESISKFINSIKNHINSLNKKDYTQILNINSPDYVFIFMPHEYAFITAQKFDQSLANFAQQKQIILVGPSTLIMCMKLVESIWRLEKQNKNSSQIADLAGSIFDQIVKTMNLLDKTSDGLNKSIENVNQVKNYIKDGRGSLLSKANQMKELGAKTKSKLESKV